MLQVRVRPPLREQTNERMTQLSIDGEPTENPRLMTREEREEHKRLLRRETEARAEWRKYLKGKQDANARHREQTRKANAAWRKARGIFNHRESSCWLIGGTERPNPEQWP